MILQQISLKNTADGTLLHGFELIGRRPVPSHGGKLFTLRHRKTGAELLYLERPVENKTFAVCFKTLPEDDTGVFHILEHSVLNGSKKYPVKEPFVSLLQSSMQTFLNALTYSDKTLFPVSSRNEQDLFNLMSVYLDAVFCPLLHERPEIFMQEGWHYELDADGTPSCHGVVFSEMKGAFANVNTLLGAETDRLLFPDTCYGFVSGGHPEHIPELTYEQFRQTHRRFYHPSNARFFLDGRMDVGRILALLDGEYLSRFERRAPDFDFVEQTPRVAEKTIFYETQEPDAMAHMVAAKLLCRHDEPEKLYAAHILADYLTGSNEAPLTRAFLERGLAQDVSLDVDAGVYQPSVSLVLRNVEAARFGELRALLPETVAALLRDGLNKEALEASLERAAFQNRELSEPSGIELCSRVLEGWRYGDDPLTHVANAGIYASLREKLHQSDYFESLLAEMLGDASSLCCLYALPSLTKGQEDAQAEAARAAAACAAWSDAERQRAQDAVLSMQRWQQTPDSDEALAALPRLSLRDVPETLAQQQTELGALCGAPVLTLRESTNGVVYLNLFFALPDFTVEELRLLSLAAACFGELRTEHIPADRLQTRLKATMGWLKASVSMSARHGETTSCTPQLLISAAMLEENVPAALELLQELLLNGRYDETDRIAETVRQYAYELKQSLTSAGHSYAITKALAPFSALGAYHEALTGERYVRWFSALAGRLETEGAAVGERLAALMQRAVARCRLFVGCAGGLRPEQTERLIAALPEGTRGAQAEPPRYERRDCAIEIPADVGFSALGGNLYASGARFTGACDALSSLASYVYLWNRIRVQGGAYGAGMGILARGDVFCYSYRDPDLAASREAYRGMADFLADFLRQGEPLDGFLIGALNAADPLISPSEACMLACRRHLNGTTWEKLAQWRRELLHTTADDLLALNEQLRAVLEQGCFCAVGSARAVSFVSRGSLVS